MIYLNCSCYWEFILFIIFVIDYYFVIFLIWYEIILNVKMNLMVLWCFMYNYDFLVVMFVVDEIYFGFFEGVFVFVEWVEFFFEGCFVLELR